MSRLNLTVVLAVIALGGCEMNAQERSPTGPLAPEAAPPREQSPDDPHPVLQPTEPGDGRPTGGIDATDRAITEQIRFTLAGDEWLSPEARDIEVETRDGVVTLRGRVESADERDIVVDIAWQTEGVRDVIDEIEVRGGLHGDDDG